MQLVWEQLLNYVTRLGVKDKYSETVTVGAVKTVYHFYLKSQSHTFKDFIVEFPRLKTNFGDIIRAHYSIDIFSLERAKTTFIDPDLLPFD